MRIPNGSSTLRRGAVVLTMLATMIGTVGIGAAQAAVTTHITAGYSVSTENFHGKVSSGNAECVPHRTVRLYKKTASGRILEGKTASGANGGWKIQVMNAHGKYVAVVPAQTEMGILCGGATSTVVDVM